MSRIVQVGLQIVEETIRALREAGARQHESVVLWLGATQKQRVDVTEAYVPVHEADKDYFHVPRSSILSLLEHQRKTSTFVACQVHSHPEEAFHSRADDRWAIVRHVGALSIVVPHFAQRTTATAFLRDVAIFQQTAAGAWARVRRRALAATLVII